MAHIIEVQGEANPLTSQGLFHVLSTLSSPNPLALRTGTEQLKNWEIQSGYFSLLQNIFADSSISKDVRYQAIIQIKNGIDRYWRKTATNAIGKEERQRIKLRAVEIGVSEPDQSLSKFNALTIAKIVRYEFPNEWPDAIATVLKPLRRASSHVEASSLFMNGNAASEPGEARLINCLDILKQMIKELSSGRLQRTKTSLQSATPEIVHFLGAVYVDKAPTRITTAHETNSRLASQNAEESLQALKVLRRLLISGYEHPNREKEVQELWSITQEQVGTLYAASVDAKSYASTVGQNITRHLLQLSKLHVQMAKDHPAAFVLLPGGLNTVRSYWDIVKKLAHIYGREHQPEDIDIETELDDDDQPLVEKLGLQGLLLMRACVKMAYNPAHTFKYQHAIDKEERKAAVELIKASLLTDGFVSEMMECLVTGFFKFRTRDLREWEEEPEEWEKREEELGDAWELSIRSCAEKLFLDLIVNFKDLLVPRLMQVFQTYAALESPDLQLKESVYAALGLAAPCLETKVDFNGFLKSNLVAEVQITGPGYNILRRRIAIMLGQWVPVKPAELDRVSIYQIFQHLLDPDDPINDHVVQVTAGRQFKAVLEPFEFQVEEFLPYSQTIIERLMRLAQRMKLPETLLALHETIRVLISKMENHIAPYAHQIIDALEALWARASANQELLIQQHVIGMLSAIITSLGRESVRYHSRMLPLVKHSIEDEEAKTYLLDEALELWTMILMGTEAPASPELLELLGCLLPILDLGTDAVRQALEIAECYFLLAPASMIMDSFLQKLLEGIKEAYDAREVTGPRHRSPSIFGVLETDYLSVLGRVALADPYIFVESCSVATGESVEQSMSWILSEWFQHFDNIGDINRKKLHCLALTHLFSIRPVPHWLLRHLQSYMTVWTDLVTELGEGAEDRDGDALLIWNDLNGEQAYTDPTETADAKRRTQLSKTDPIHTVNIRSFVSENLRGVIVDCGGEARFQGDWLVSIDREIINAFGALNLF